MNIACTIERMARERPDAPALVAGDRRISFSELNRTVNRLANGLRKLGIREGDRVAIMLPNTPEFVYAFYACQKIGAIVVPFNTMYKAAEIRYILRDSGACALICLTNFIALINEVRGDLPNLRNVITTGERGVTFAVPHSTVFVQAVVGNKTLGDSDTAYRKIGEAFVEALKSVGVVHAEYCHRGAIRCSGRKVAAFTVSTVEELYVVNGVCFADKFDPGDFMSVVWVPPEVRDKLIEPVTSIAEECGRCPSALEIETAFRQAVERVVGTSIVEGEMTREERFAYAKQRALLMARPRREAATSPGRLVKVFERIKHLFRRIFGQA